MAPSNSLKYRSVPSVASRRSSSPTYPTPIPSPVRNLRPARYICEGLPHARPLYWRKAAGQIELWRRRKNTETQSVVVLHLGGRDSLSHLTGIHGVHLGHIEYIDTDDTRTTIPWVEKTNADGSKTVFTTSALKGAMPKGERRVMDCIDCHNRAAHTMQTAEDALNRAMAEGAVSPDVPFVHKKGLELLKGEYATSDEASAKIPVLLAAFYKAEHPDVYVSKSAEISLPATGWWRFSPITCSRR